MNGFLIGLFLGTLLGLAIPPFYKWIVNVVTKKNGAAIVVLALLLASCGTQTGDPNVDTISFSQAWSHVAGFTSYWVWLFLSVLPTVVYVMYLIVNKDSQLNLILLFVCLALLMAGMLYAPAECAANTTIEQAARGVYIR